MNCVLHSAHGTGHVCALMCPRRAPGGNPWVSMRGLGLLCWLCVEDAHCAPGRLAGGAPVPGPCPALAAGPSWPGRAVLLALQLCGQQGGRPGSCLRGREAVLPPPPLGSLDFPVGQCAGGGFWELTCPRAPPGCGDACPRGLLPPSCFCRASCGDCSPHDALGTPDPPRC